MRSGSSPLHAECSAVAVPGVLDLFGAREKKLKNKLIDRLEYTNMLGPLFDLRKET